jgi:2-dehydro-3-deoxyphosphogluconate aldolase / (4S)-4-hydroxy-2-oxoglutarate aldolase
MARFNRLTVLNTIMQDAMVPLFYDRNLETAQQIAGAIAAGGGHLLEFTNRGDFAIEVFSALVKQCAKTSPDLIIGVGTVEDAATAALFIAHGANFVVGPSFDMDTARLCNRHKIPYVPGCATVTEIATAEEWGTEVIKVFPGETIGGPDFIKAVLGPRPWSCLMPTGGVTPEADNLRGWFGAGVVAVGMGSKLIRGEWVKAGNYDAIQGNVKSALELISTIRKEKK